MGSRKKAVVLTKECVACGCCVKSCPLAAVSIYKGMYALVDENKCAGCGRCITACPAQVISLAVREAVPC